MSVMPTSEAEKAYPDGERMKVRGGLEIQLATIRGEKKMNVGPGGHGPVLPVPYAKPGLVVFQQGNYAGHYVLPEDIANLQLPQLWKTEYVREILERYRQ